MHTPTEEPPGATWASVSCPRILQRVGYSCQESTHPPSNWWATARPPEPQPLRGKRVFWISVIKEKTWTLEKATWEIKRWIFKMLLTVRQKALLPSLCRRFFIFYCLKCFHIEAKTTNFSLILKMMWPWTKCQITELILIVFRESLNQSFLFSPQQQKHSQKKALRVHVSGCSADDQW